MGAVQVGGDTGLIGVDMGSALVLDDDLAVIAEAVVVTINALQVAFSAAGALDMVGAVVVGGEAHELVLMVHLVTAGVALAVGICVLTVSVEFFAAVTLCGVLVLSDVDIFLNFVSGMIHVCQSGNGHNADYHGDGKQQCQDILFHFEFLQL